MGTVFSLSADGAAFTNLHSFAGDSEGSYPRAVLVSVGDMVYGTTSGTPRGDGTVFRINADGTGFTNLVSSIYTPHCGLVVLGNTLYGTTTLAGSASKGTVFAVRIDGTGFTNLHSFTALNYATNNDGCVPEGALMSSSNTLYGTASRGGGFGNGTIFKITPDGSFTTIHSFALTFGPLAANADGAIPRAALTSSDGTLYGTTSAGGTFGSGTVFKLNTDGTGFQVLHNFATVPTPLNNPTNTDGSQPLCALVLLGKTLYGTTSVGGPWGKGTVFAINTDGTGFITLHNFTGGGDGVSPLAGLVLSGNKLYGTANSGGNVGYGTIFSVSLPMPQLTITPSSSSIILTWPTNFSGFDLQSTTNLNLGIWTPVSLTPSLANGRNTVTNPISGAQQFFRLSQ
jgi:uncharacterized repeat protein (TIGR03803 family)